MRAGLLIVALAFIAITASRTSSAGELTTGVIEGSVRAVSGKAISGAKVSAKSSSGRYGVVTNKQGSFVFVGVAPGVYSLSVTAVSYAPVDVTLRVAPGQEQRTSFVLINALQTIAAVRSRSTAFTLGSTSDRFDVNGAAARASSPTTASAGLSTYSQATVQGAIASVPGVDLDTFGNAILRAGRVGDAVFDYDSVPIPQGLIVEPGGNVDGAQLPTTGVASTSVTLAGFSNESGNALGGVVDEIPAIGTYPGSVTEEVGEGLGTLDRYGSLSVLDATPDLRWRYAFASTFETQYFSYGNGHSFYPAEAGTFGLALQNRSQFSTEANVHYQMTPQDDLSLLSLTGQATYDQYGSPFSGESIGRFDGSATIYPGEVHADEQVNFASGVRGKYDLLKAEWLHRTANAVYRLQLYDSATGSSAGGPFWDDNGFPDGSISLFETLSLRQYGLNLDGETLYGNNRVRFGATYRTETSDLNEVVPTADEFISSHPTIDSTLAYVGDTWDASDRLELSGTGRLTLTHIKPSTGFAYDTSALDPHVGIAYRVAPQYSFRIDYDRISVAPAPLEADRTDSTNVTSSGAPAPFVQLAPETANDFTYSFEGSGRIQFRLTYYQKYEKNLIDVLPFNFRSAVSAGLNPTGVGVPTNAGNLTAKGAELYVKDGPATFSSNYSRAFSSSASQFAYNDLNAPAVAAGHLFPVGYEPDFTAELSYELPVSRRLRVNPSVSYSTGYPYGNGTMVWVFDPKTGKPIQVPNDNFVNPGTNYYFLKNPSRPFNALTNPYIGTLGTNEGADPNSLRSPSEFFVNFDIQADVARRLTAILDVSNLLGNFAPTAYQSNPYLIGPPGYGGGNPAYARYYQGLIGSQRPYTLGNGVPTNNGFTQALPWSYGRNGYVPQSYPLGRSWQIRLRYHL